MSGLKETIKGGWNPKGWTGRGKDSHEPAKDHVSLPLSSLKDPASFGPPPKNVNYNRETTLPNKTVPDKGRLGAPLKYDRIKVKIAEEEPAKVEEDEQERAPPLPSRMDTRNEGNGKSSTIVPRPGLPPRLPPRQGSSPMLDATSPPQHGAVIEESPKYRGILNQGSINRLGASGISVPGFGIGNKQTLSQLTPPSGSTSTPGNCPTNPSSSQLNELQSRFSSFGASSPVAKAPPQGTTWSQKQAAFKTAAAFREDPASVSFADARAAASTANNFRERHSDQMKAGLNSANKLNQKYGVAGKFQEFSNANADKPTHSEPTPSPKVDTKDFAFSAKKSPPPPPKKKAALQGTMDMGAEPPPLPLASKPKPKDSSRTTNLISRQHSDHNPEWKYLDFDLKSLWFAKSPLVFPPPSINRLPGTRSTAFDYGWSSSDGIRKTHFFTGAIRHNNTLETTKIHLSWDASNPGLTLKEEQKHLPPPRALDVRELEKFRIQYAERIAGWCESMIGQQVGNGECWTLAENALSSVASELRARNGEPCMTSQGLIHGYQIYCYIPQRPSDPPGGIKAAGVARGDIVQFFNTHFQRKDGRGSSYAGSPDHTAVVVAVEADGALKVLEQNASGVKRVRPGRYDPEELVAGELRVFRAVGESWVGPLDAKWP